MADRILKPAGASDTRFTVIAALLAAVVLWALFAWVTQLRAGLGVTGLRDWGVRMGAPWGMYVAAFIWLDGIALGGMALSAAIRLFRMRTYYAAARLAEVLAVITMAVGAFMLLTDIGRPDRMLNLLLYFPSRMTHSPLTLDFVTVSAFMVLGIIYVLRNRDAAADSGRGLPLALLLLSLGMAGIVVPSLFGTISSQAGWFSTILGPLFLTAAIATGVAATMLIAGLYRQRGFEREFPDKVFHGLGRLLFLSIAAYGYLSFIQESLVHFAPPVTEELVGEAILVGEYALWFWLAVLALAAAGLYLLYQWAAGSRPDTLSMLAVPAAVLAALFVKRYLLVVPTFLFTRLPYTTGSYSASWVEWSLLAGTVAMVALLFMVVARLFPLMGERPEAGGR